MAAEAVVALVGILVDMGGFALDASGDSNSRISNKEASAVISLKFSEIQTPPGQEKLEENESMRSSFSAIRSVAAKLFGNDYAGFVEKAQVVGKCSVKKGCTLKAKLRDPDYMKKIGEKVPIRKFVSRAQDKNGRVNGYKTVLGRTAFPHAWIQGNKRVLPNSNEVEIWTWVPRGSFNRNKHQVVVNFNR